VIIAGGMGGGAISIFNEKGIDIVTGASGKCEENVKSYIDGNLKTSGSVCNQHQHHSGSCGSHNHGHGHGNKGRQSR
jgi:predicted Fe-Mo cluster-binding NifX family protein